MESWINEKSIASPAITPTLQYANLFRRRSKPDTRDLVWKL